MRPISSTIAAVSIVLAGALSALAQDVALASDEDSEAGIEAVFCGSPVRSLCSRTPTPIRAFASRWSFWPNDPVRCWNATSY